MKDWPGPLQSANVFPRLAVQLIHVGEEAGQLDTMLLQMADIYDEEVKRTVFKGCWPFWPQWSRSGLGCL